MRQDDGDRPRGPTAHQLGEPVDDLSVEEIGNRIALLEREIERLEEARAAKAAARDAASSIFRS